MATFTNLLAMPLVQMSVFTGTNEDWIDSIKYVVDTGDEDPPQLDIRGIYFEMEVRRGTPEHEVVFSANTDDGTLAIGSDPDYGFLLINISHKVMLEQAPGMYVADIVGTDAHNIRRCVVIDLEIVHGVTRP